MAKKIITNLEKGYITTPNGKLMFLNVSGQGKLNYKQNGYEYVAAIQLDGDEAKAFKKEVDAYIEDNKPKKGKLRSGHHPYYTHKDNDKIPKGSIRVQFKTNTEFSSGDKTVVNVFDGNLKKVHLADGVKIGNDSLGAISGKISIGTAPGEYWCSFYLSNVQLLMLVPYEENSGFEEQDGDEFDNIDEGESEKKKDKKKKKSKKD